MLTYADVRWLLICSGGGRGGAGRDVTGKEGGERGEGGGGVTQGAGEERKREVAAEAVVREDRMLPRP